MNYFLPNISDLIVLLLAILSVAVACITHHCAAAAVISGSVVSAASIPGIILEPRQCTF